MAARTRKPAAPAAPVQPPFDGARLLADLRRGDEAAMAQAYRQTFGTSWGRLVLVDIAAQAGVGRKFGGELTREALAYHQGGHDVALEIMERAGFDPASAALMTITGDLEGRDDDPTAYAEPDPELSD